jgi:chorismate mutase
MRGAGVRCPPHRGLIRTAPRRIARMRLFALRGAITAERNEREPILEATSELLEAVLARNALDPEEIVSVIFTVTDDLDAEFPAVAARALGFERVPLLCAREIPVPGSLPLAIRVLMHYHASDEHRAQHVYLREAVRLRGDLQSAQ